MPVALRADIDMHDVVPAVCADAAPSGQVFDEALQLTLADAGDLDVGRHAAQVEGLRRPADLAVSRFRAATGRDRHRASVVPLDDGEQPPQTVVQTEAPASRNIRRHIAGDCPGKRIDRLARRRLQGLGAPRRWWRKSGRSRGGPFRQCKENAKAHEATTRGNRQFQYPPPEVRHPTRGAPSGKMGRDKGLNGPGVSISRSGNPGSAEARPCPMA